MRLSDLKTNHFFCLASAASVSVQLQLARLTAEMNTYQFTVGRQFVLLDPMDLVTLTEPGLQLNNQLVRITEIQENLDGTLTMTAVEVQGVAAAAVYPRQISQGLARNNNAPAPVVNTPIFFEPPDQLGGGLVIWIGLSGSVPANWGALARSGCLVRQRDLYQCRDLPGLDPDGDADLVAGEHHRRLDAADHRYW